MAFGKGPAWVAAKISGYKTCFSAGTPIRTPAGSCVIERIRVGDMVLSRDEHNPDGVIVAQRVEEVFARNGLIWELRLGGQTIRSTAEHPFYRDGDGWVPLHLLRVGDRLKLEDGSWSTIEGVRDTGRYEAVYNFRVREFHTYFVGDETTWGWAVWAHNACIGKDVQDGLTAVGLNKTNNPTAKRLAGMANDPAVTRGQLIAEIQRLRPGTNKYQASWLVDNLHGKAGRAVGAHPETFLQEALRRQGLTTPPSAGQFKEPQKGMPKWTDGSYNYEVRMHPAEAASAGKTGFIYRVERHSLALDPVTKQGMGREYLDHNGVWHHTKTLTPGTPPGNNPLFNPTAAADTHIQY